MQGVFSGLHTLLFKRIKNLPHGRDNPLREFGKKPHICRSGKVIGSEKCRILPYISAANRYYISVVFLSLLSDYQYNLYSNLRRYFLLNHSIIFFTTAIAATKIVPASNPKVICRKVSGQDTR